MASYRVSVDRQARKEIRRLPGDMRQRVIRILRALEKKPRPHTGHLLDTAKAGIELDAGVDLYRIRMESWRIVYVIEDEWELITVPAIRKRPPYQYEDLEGLMGRV
ncbi:MAG: hypothetical protein KKD28_00075 [Chloroflexi bacterium]|nr:hypothetical protein [Chloroflexota bacterium]MBU1659852.1 hypothetical protein [Chloroflexota bacterium]